MLNPLDQVWHYLALFPGEPVEKSKTVRAERKKSNGVLKCVGVALEITSGSLKKIAVCLEKMDEAIKRLVGGVKTLNRGLKQLRGKGVAADTHLNIMSNLRSHQETLI